MYTFGGGSGSSSSFTVCVRVSEIETAPLTGGNKELGCNLKEVT